MTETKETGTQLSFNAEQAVWGRIFDALEREAEWLQAQGLSEADIETTLTQAVELHRIRSMVIGS